MNPIAGSRRLGSRSEAAAATHLLASPVGWRDVVAAVVPLAVLAAVATAYGFLDGNSDHPSLELGGAFIIAGLASAVVFLDRASLLRHSPEILIDQRTASIQRDRRDILRTGLVFLSVATALIHFAVIEQHSTEYWGYGAFFIVIALFELIWALLLMAAPSRLLYVAAIVVNGLTVVAYVITRTVGVLVGPSAAETERVGFGDVVATAFEVLIVVGCWALLLRPWGRRRVRAAASEAWMGTIAIGVTGFTTLALFSAVAGPPFVSRAG